MKQIRAVLKADCEDLHSQLDLGSELHRALNGTYSGDRQKLNALTARSRRQSYVNGVVSIYGLLEENIDKLVIEVASAYGGIFELHSDLPERMRDAHREYLLRFLLEKDKIRLREPIQENAALHALMSASSGVSPNLLPSILTYATANYRHSYILDLLHRVDVDARKRVEGGRVAEKLADSGLNFASVDSLILDLVTRRNEVAHSYHTVDMLDVDTLKAYLDVMQAYIQELQIAASEKVLRVLSEKRLQPIGKVAKAWTSALGVDMDAGSIEAPCSVLLVRESGISALDIDSLQSGGQSIPGTVRHLSDVLKMGLGFSAGKPGNVEGASVFVLPDRWEYLRLF
ncbi:hypothetical protein ACIQUQ_06080 [Streptomyces sp. NPDC101118]|uniref:hypothetical protein n=1 Tax=Streptomyces sp. NPDC101118 TaxID=3366109 RepID=UPI00382296CC